jgi:TolB-like protein
VSTFGQLRTLRKLRWVAEFDPLTLLSVFTYKGKLVKVRQVAEELGVRYVMEGSVRRVGNQVRINAQLIDATTGGPFSTLI